jgi:chromosome segregation ATPase
MYESKGAIPQLEASLRTREQRIATYQQESETLRARITQLESTLSQKENEIVKRDRDIRRLTSEVELAKDEVGAPSGEPLPFDGVREPAPPADPSVEARLKKVEARYEALKRGIIQRDEKIVGLEHALQQAKERSSMTQLESELEELTQSAQSLASTLAGRDDAMKDLEARLQREAEQREALEALAKRRGDANRELKEKLAKIEVQLPKLLETMKARNALIAERDATIRALGSELEHAKTERADRDASIVSLTHKLDMSQQDVATREARIDEQQHRMHELERRIDGLTHELAGTNRMLQRAEATIQERDASLAAQSEQIALTEERDREHQQAMAALSGTVRDRDFRIDALDAEVSKLSSALDVARQESSAVQATNAGANDRFAAETKSLRDRADLLTRQNDQLQRDLVTRDRKLSEVERERARLAERVAELDAPDSRLQTLEAQLNAARERCVRIEDELLEANKDAKQLRNRVAELEARGTTEPTDQPLDPEDADVPLLNISSIVAPPPTPAP